MKSGEQNFKTALTNMFKNIEENMNIRTENYDKDPERTSRTKKYMCLK